MSNDAALERFLLATEHFEAGDFAAAADGFADVWKVQRELGGVDLEGDAGTATPAMVLVNLASACQRLGAWDRMLEATRALLAVEASPVHRMLHAIALKHCDASDQALAEIRAVVAEAPDFASGHYELAIQLLARGHADDALASLSIAIEAGASIDEVAADAELAALANDPRFLELTSDGHAQAVLGRRIAHLHEALTPGVLDDAYIDRMEAILPLVGQLLEVSGISDLDRVEASARVRPASLSATQRSTVEQLLDCPQLWHAIPFLELLLDAGLPGTTRDEARSWLE